MTAAVLLHADQPMPSEIGKYSQVESLSARLLQDSDMQRLLQLKRLTELRMARTAVTDGGMNVVAQLVSLRLLDLTGTHVTSEGVKRLRDLARLDSLFINDTDVDDRAAPAIASHADLRVLHLGSRVTSSGLKSLSGLANSRNWFWQAELTTRRWPGCVRFCTLRFISSLAKVTDRGLSDLGCLTCLQTIDLDDAQVGDDGISHLDKMDAVTTLHLANTLVTDTGLSYLARLRSLTALDLSEHANNRRWRCTPQSGPFR